MIKNCPNCQKEFNGRPLQKACSRACQYKLQSIRQKGFAPMQATVKATEYWKTHKRNPEVYKLIGDKQRGRKVSMQSKIKNSKSHYKIRVVETRKHEKIRQQMGRPAWCFECGTRESSQFEWANIDGAYDETNLNSWARLCKYCHNHYDLAERYGHAKVELNQPYRPSFLVFNN